MAQKHAPGFEGTPEATYIEAEFHARQRLLDKARAGQSPDEAIHERMRYTLTVLAARSNLPALLTPRAFDTAWLVPVITIAVWVLIAWMYLSR